MVATVGWTGSRRLAHSYRPLIFQITQAVWRSGRRSVVGDARGADALIQQGFAQAGGSMLGVPVPALGAEAAWFEQHVPDRVRVERATSQKPYELIARSEAIVQAVVAGGPGSALIGFVDIPCPATIKPGRTTNETFNGSGSGTWSSLALACGRGAAIVVFWCHDSVPQWPDWGGTWTAAGTTGIWSSGMRWTPPVIVAEVEAVQPNPSSVSDTSLMAAEVPQTGAEQTLLLDAATLHALIPLEQRLNPEYTARSPRPASRTPKRR